MQDSIIIKPDTIIQAGTGTGKSYSIIKHIKDNPYKKFLILTDTNSNVDGYREETSKYKDLDTDILFLNAETKRTVHIDDNGYKTTLYNSRELTNYRILITTHTYAGYKGDTLEEFTPFQIFKDKVHSIIIDEAHKFMDSFHKSKQIMSYYAKNTYGEYKITEKVSKDQDVIKSSDMQFIDATLGTTPDAQQFILKRTNNIDVTDSFNFHKYIRNKKNLRINLEEFKELREKNEYYTEKVYNVPRSLLDSLLVEEEKNEKAIQFILRLMNANNETDHNVKVVVKESKIITSEIDGEKVSTNTKFNIKNPDSVWIYWHDVIKLPKDKTTFLTATLNEEEIPEYYKSMSIERIKPKLDHVDINEINLYTDSKHKAYKIYNDLSVLDKAPTMVVTKTKEQAKEQRKLFNTKSIKRWQSDKLVSKHEDYELDISDIALTYGLHPKATGSNQTEFKNIIVECDLYRPLISRIKCNRILTVEEDVVSTVVQNIGRVLRTNSTDYFNGVRNIYLSKASEELVNHVANELINTFGDKATINVPVGTDTANQVIYEGILLPLSYCDNKTVTGLYKYLNGSKDKKDIKKELGKFVSNGTLEVDSKNRYKFIAR